MQNYIMFAKIKNYCVLCVKKRERHSVEETKLSIFSSSTEKYVESRKEISKKCELSLSKVHFKKWTMKIVPLDRKLHRVSISTAIF